MNRQPNLTPDPVKSNLESSNPNGNGNGKKTVTKSVERWQHQLYKTIDKFQSELEQSETVDKHKIAAKLKKLAELVKNTSLTDNDAAKNDRLLEDIYLKATNKLVESTDSKATFQTIAKGLKEALECDRVAIYRYNQDWSGQLIAESYQTGWESITEKQQENPEIIQNFTNYCLRDLLGFNSAEDAARDSKKTDYPTYSISIETITAVQDIYNEGLPESHLKTIESHQAKAYTIFAIYQGERLWGLLGIYQNSGPRNWQEEEIERVIKTAKLFGIALQKSDYLAQIQAQQEKLQKQTETDKALTKILDRIRQSQDLQAIFNVNTSEIRQLLKCDRVAIYRFNEDYTGQIIAESVGSEWVSLLQEQRNSNEIVANINACSVRDLATKYETVPVSKPNFNSDTYLQQTGGGNFNFGEVYTVQNDIYQAKFSQCYIQALEKYQARAYIIVAIYQNRKLWGLLAAYQNSGPREWRSPEIELMVRIANQFSIAIQQSEYLKQIQASNQDFKRRAEEESTLAKIGERIRQSNDLDSIFNIVTSELRQLLKCDRAAIYQFNPQWGGKFIAESVGSQWVSVIEQQNNNPKIKDSINQCSVRDLARSGGLVGQENVNSIATDTYFQQSQNINSFTQGQLYRVQNDIRANPKLNDCYIDSLEAFQARSYIVVAIYQGRKLWGLLAVYQNNGPRNWQEREIELLVKIANQFSLAVQQAEYIKQLEAKNVQISKIVEGEKSIARLIEKLGQRITQGLDLNEIFRLTISEIRLLIKCDRVAIYRFDADFSGEFIAESVSSDWPDLVGSNIKTVWEDTHFQETKGGRYARKESFAVDDIYTIGHSQCHIDILEQFQIRAYAIAPIFVNNKLWGLLGAYQNSGPRHWQSQEVQLLVKLGVQIGVAILQSNYLQELKIKNTQLQQNVQEGKATVQIIEQIRQAQDLNSIFRNTLNDSRRLIQCDRLAVYRFNPDFSGEFIAEAFDSKWVSLVSLQDRDEAVRNDLIDSGVCTIKQYGSPAKSDADTYMQETKGGIYLQGIPYRKVDDIYKAGFSDCYLKSLEKFQAKAYIIVPIFRGTQLWGLLAVYDNTGPRQWQEREIQLMLKLGANYSVAVQEMEYLQDALDKNQKLTRAIENETANARFFSKLPATLVDLAKDDRPNNIKDILQFTVNQLRQLLKTDRVGVYRFDPDWSGEFLVESVGGKWPQLVGTPKARITDTYLQENNGGRYASRQSLQVDNLYTAGHDECHFNLLEEWGTKAYVIAPIFAGEELWGLLGVYQNSNTRDWENAEVNIISQTGIQIGVAIALADALTKVRNQEQQLAEIAEKEKQAKENLQKGALMLLRSIEPSFLGDLTVRAPLSDDEIGTIADAFNTTISCLRDLVAQVQIAAERVSQTSNENSESVTQLSDRAREQVTQLKKALTELQLMVAATKMVVADAEKVEIAVQEANKTVNTGDNLMEKTVDGILEIRNTVSQTAKKIKRLGEASQKIFKVVNLIENFATQTNLLALNAAIEATRAGEYGKGFAVVADEVRSLAYQSANATTEINRIVEEIQGEVKEVTEAMEIGIAQVVEGTTLVKETRESLSEIVTATDLISSLVTNITATASNQSDRSHKLTEAMNKVATIARSTADNATSISDSFQELLATSEDLETSVSQFKVD